MASRIHQTARARADLLAIWLDVAAADPGATDRLFDRLEARVRILETFAERPVGRGPTSRLTLGGWSDGRT